MSVMSPVMIKNQQCNIIENENRNMCKIFNLDEVEILFEKYCTYRIFLYTINTLDYVEIKSTEFLRNLELYCTENLNYSIINYIDDDQKILKLFITPIVTSA